MPVMPKKRTTKSNLTLSVRKECVEMLSRASTRSGRSITALIEELAEQLDRETRLEDNGDAWVKRNMGILNEKVKPSDWERDDRFGEILRKHVPR